MAPPPRQPLLGGSLALRGPVREPRPVGHLENLAFLTIVTVLLLSMWGPAIIRVQGFYAPEALAPPLAVYLWTRRPRLVRSVLRCVLSPVGLVGTIWLTLVAALGAFSFGSVVGPYSEWRASLLLLYSFLFMYTREHEQGQIWATRLMWISFAVLCLDLLLTVLGILMPGFLGQPIQTAEEASMFGFGRVSVPAINLVVVSYLAARGPRVGLLATTLALGGVLSLGGHRVLLVTTAICALLLPLAMAEVVFARRMASRWLRLALAPVLVVAMVSAVRSSIIQDYLAEARGIQFRLFTHSIDTVLGIQRGLTSYVPIDYGDETIRAAYAAYVVTQWPSLLLPHGLGSREVQGRLGPEFNDVALRWRVEPKNGNTHDNGIVYAAYHHGLLLTGVIALSVAALLVYRLAGERGFLGKMQVAVAVAGVIVIDLVYPPVPGINESCIYGLFVGALLNHAALRPVPVLRRRPRRNGRGSTRPGR